MRDPELCAVILAGGKSRRMGVDKALLSLLGRPMIAHVADEALRLTDEVWISANKDHPFRFLGLPVIEDVYPGQGPLAGLHATMLRTARPLILLLACDLPGIRAPFLQRLVASIPGYDAVIPRTGDGRAHPLCSVFRRESLSGLEGNLRAQRNKVLDFVTDSSLKVLWLTEDDGRFEAHDLCNINTPEDFASYREGPD